MSAEPVDISHQLPPAPLIAQAPEIQRKTRRKYSDIEIAAALIALDANKGNVFKTSHELGIPHKTLDEWATNNRRMNGFVATVRTENTRALGDIMEETARNYLAQANDPFVIAATNGRDAVFSAAIAVDKMQLLRGQPTEIVEHVESKKVLVLIADALGVGDPPAELSEGETTTSCDIPSVAQDNSAGDLQP